MTQCGFAGNSDIYGIGIRIGYYSQILAIWFSNYFLFREAKSFRAVNNIFLLALIVAGFIYFVNARKTFAIEAFLLLQIGLITGVVGITEATRYATKYRASSQERQILRIYIMVTGGFFNAIFFWKGVDVMLPTPCGTYVFYLFKVNMYGWLKIVMRVQSLFAAVWTIPNLVSRDAADLYYDVRMRKTRELFVNAVSAAATARSQGLELQPAKGFARANKSSQQATGLNTQIGITPISADEEISRCLKNVAKAEKYIDSILSIYPPKTTLPGEKRSLRLLGGCAKFSISKTQKTPCKDSTPYKHCISTTFKVIWENKPPMHLRNRLSLHTLAIGAMPPWRWPRLVNRMYELDRVSETPDWPYFTIASDLNLSQISVPNSTTGWAFDAGRQFVFIILLVIQVELTIAWNHVSGLQSLSTVGQLIPFILGVGGLVKVLWGKGRMIWRSEKEEDWGREGLLGDYEKAMARYVELKKPDAGRRFVRAATA